MANESEVVEFLSDVFEEDNSTLKLQNLTSKFQASNGSRSLFFSNKEAPNLLAPNYFSFERHIPQLPNTISGKIITGCTVYDASFIFVLLFAVACIKDRRISQQKECIFIPKRPVRGFRKYALLLETGHSPAGGTTSGVFVRLCGKLTKSPAFSLSWRNEVARPLFWSQGKDVFILSVPHYLGYIYAVEVMTDSAGQSPPWFLRSIRVMSLDNRKCWKAKAHAWLRGDRKPFSFRASLIGALSTRDYMRKVFLQNHSWTMMWKRKLGSAFTCRQRCSILWISVLGGMFGAHFLMYKWPYSKEAQTDKASGLRIPVQYVVRGDDAVAAGVLGGLAGAVLGMILRALARFTSRCGHWARVDDKDDFAHIMYPGDLIYTDGAVVLAHRPTYTGPKIPPFPPCVDDTVLKILDSLTPTQIEAVRRMIDSGDNYPYGSPANNSYRQDGPASPIPGRVDNPVNGPEMTPANASRSGYKKRFANAMSSLWGSAKRLGSPSDRETSSGMSDKEMYLPGPSAGVVTETKSESSPNRKARKFSRRSKKSKPSRVKFSDQDNVVPYVSARFWKVACNENALPDDYDSVSDPESDEDVVVKALRGGQDLNRRRRPQKVYDEAPWWDDRHRVYVAAPDSGNYHFEAVDERYDRTNDPETACCLLRNEAKVGEDAVLQYMEGDAEAESSADLSGSPTTSIICALCLLVAIALGPFIVYERLPLPNAHALYYLYAVMLCLVFHATMFCSADAMLCAVLATCARRRRIACVRNRMPVDSEVDAEA